MTIGSYNIIFGQTYGCGNAITSGSSNIAIGGLGAYLLTPSCTGSNNIAIGPKSLNGNTSGSLNIGLGYFSGQNVTTNTSVTLIGSHTDVQNSSINNATAIGSGSIVNVLNCIQLGRTGLDIIKCGSFISVNENQITDNQGHDVYISSAPPTFILEPGIESASLINCSDMSGKISITAGNSPLSNSPLLSLYFNKMWGLIPNIV